MYRESKALFKQREYMKISKTAARHVKVETVENQPINESHRISRSPY